MQFFTGSSIGVNKLTGNRYRDDDNKHDGNYNSKNSKAENNILKLLLLCCFSLILHKPP